MKTSTIRRAIAGLLSPIITLQSEKQFAADRARQVTSLRHKSNPLVPDMTDIQPWMFYDRLTAAAASQVTQNLLFFTTPLSSGKTKLDTNLKQAGRLPDPKHFLLMAIRFVFSSDMAIADIQNILKSYYVELEIGDKIFSEGHLDLFPGGAGLDGTTSTTVAASTSGFTNNGNPNPLATNNWGTEHGIHIQQGQTFQVRCIAPTAITMAAGAAGGTGMNLRCVFDGILYREVQ